MTETVENIRFDGSRLQIARKGKSMSEIARAIGVSRQSLLQIEQGKTKPSADTIVKLCAVLNIPISDLTKIF